MQCNMATTRKKQDDKHLKILRELVSLPANKQCFDCHQRGPTYVNMTIGSYVCTTCSGMLRGLTPPHRVKSISMASFSPEEVESMKARGNEYCRQIWLGLYDPNHGEDTKDEQQIKDFMIAKYEKKRYYIDPTSVSTTTVTNNGSASFSPSTARSESRTSTPTLSVSKSDLSSLLGSQSKPLVLNVQASSIPANNPNNMFTPDKSSEEFFTDFSSADPFSSPQFTPTATSSEASFANFDNNPIFNSFSTTPASHNQMFGSVMSNDATLPRCNINRWSMPTSATLSSMYNVASFTSSPSRKLSGSAVFQQQQAMGAVQPALGSTQQPTEDRYAALKDLDCLMKTQTQQHTTEPQHATVAPASKMNNGFSMHGGSVFGSPSQGGFLNSAAMQAAFPEPAGTGVANPFTGATANPWSTTASTNNFPSGHPGSFNMNPFQTAFAVAPDPAWNGMGVNGLPNGQVPNGGYPSALFPSSQSMNFPAKTWHNGPSANPFILGTSPAAPGHSSNPFL